MALELKIFSMDAAGSLSLADANFDGVKHHDLNKISPFDETLNFVIAVAACTGIFVALFAMWVESSLITFIACAFPLVTGPMIISQRHKIQWLPTFKEEANNLRLSLNDLAMQRNRLTNEMSRLERQVIRMSPIEERFVHVIKREGGDYDQLKGIVKENTKIQVETQKLQASLGILNHFNSLLDSHVKSNDNSQVSEESLDEFVRQTRQLLLGKPIKEEAIREAFKTSLMKPTAPLFNSTPSMLEEQEQEKKSIDDKYAASLVGKGKETNPMGSSSPEKIEDDDSWEKVKKVPSERLTFTGLEPPDTITVALKDESKGGDQKKERTTVEDNFGVTMNMPENIPSAPSGGQNHEANHDHTSSAGKVRGNDNLDVVMSLAPNIPSDPLTENKHETNHVPTSSAEKVCDNGGSKQVRNFPPPVNRRIILTSTGLVLPDTSTKEPVSRRKSKQSKKNVLLDGMVTLKSENAESTAPGNTEEN